MNSPILMIPEIGAGFSGSSIIPSSYYSFFSYNIFRQRRAKEEVVYLMMTISSCFCKQRCALECFCSKIMLPWRCGNVCPTCVCSLCLLSVAVTAEENHTQFCARLLCVDLLCLWRYQNWLEKHRHRPDLLTGVFIQPPWLNTSELSI